MTTTWEQAKQCIGTERIVLGPQASDQWLHAPEHLGMVIARYRAAAALIGSAVSVLEIGCGEGIGARILARGRQYFGIDTDEQAIRIAQEYPRRAINLSVRDALEQGPSLRWAHDAVVALDVIEHIASADTETFMRFVTDSLSERGVCVIGTPSKHAAHLASPQSKAGHINLYTPDRLQVLMSNYFHVVQMLYMQDTAIHFGHPEMAHYLLAVGVMPR